MYKTLLHCCANNLQHTVLTEPLHHWRFVFFKQYATQQNTHTQKKTQTGLPQPGRDPVLNYHFLMQLPPLLWRVMLAFCFIPFVFSVRSLWSILTKTPWPCLPFRHRYPSAHKPEALLWLEKKKPPPHLKNDSQRKLWELEWEMGCSLMCWRVCVHACGLRVCAQR